MTSDPRPPDFRVKNLYEPSPADESDRARWALAVTTSGRVELPSRGGLGFRAVQAKRAGLAFNPDVPPGRVEPFLKDADLALCMTVFPGFGGQPYIPESTERVRQLRAMILRHNPDCELEVDGGIDARTVPLAAGAGADVFVAGTAVFGAAGGPAAAVRELQRLAAAARPS